MATGATREEIKGSVMMEQGPMQLDGTGIAVAKPTRSRQLATVNSVGAFGVDRIARGLVYCVAIATFVSGCGKPDPADRFLRPEEVTDFAVLFGKNCSGCHGMDGQLGPAPALNDPMFQAIVSNEQLAKVVTEGRAGTLMPAFDRSHGGPLTSEQIQIIVDGIRKEWAGGSAGQVDLPDYEVSPDDPAGLANGNIERGRVTFAAACASCHGEGGTGDEAGRKLAIHSLGLLTSDQSLRRTIITGRPDLDMPNHIDVGKTSSLGRGLTKEEIVDLAVYVRSIQGMESLSHVARATDGETGNDN